VTVAKTLQRLLDWFHYARKEWMCFLAYVSMRFYGIEPTLEDVREESYSHRQHSNRNLDQAKDLDGLLSMAKDCWKRAVDRRAAVTDKCKTLLTLSSLLLGIVGVLLPKQLTFDAHWMRLLVLVSILSLLNAVALLVVFFGIGREMVIALDQENVGLDTNDLKKSLINSYLACQVSMDGRTDYLVDLFKTARFFFLTAFSLLVLLVSVNFFTQSPTGEVEKTIAELRGSPELIELLRGPKGGPGEKGDTGSEGPQGEKGERGENGKVDLSDIVDALVKDPRLEMLVKKAIESD